MAQANIIQRNLLLNVRSLFYGSFFLFLFYVILYAYTSNLDFETFRTRKESSSSHWEYPQDDWKSVGNSIYNFSVYSAYSVGEQQVTIIGSSGPFSVFFKPVAQCAFYWSCANSTNCDESVANVPATIQMMSLMLPHLAGTLIKCLIPAKVDATTNKLESPSFVSVLIGNQTESPVRLPIQYRSYPVDEYPFKFAVCVPPLKNYNDVFHFLEWLEFYRAMGVERFTFYNTTVGPDTTCVIENLRTKLSDIVDIIVKPWQNVPFKNVAQISFGSDLRACANDCLYSHKGVSKYVVFVDMNEFIVPLQGIQNYTQLIDFVHSQLPSKPANETKQIGEYAFRSGVYLTSKEVDDKLEQRCAVLEDNMVEYKVCQRLWTMAFSQRETIADWESRSEYIAVPEGVSNAGSRFALDFEEGWTGQNISARIAFSRRYNEFGGTNKTFLHRMQENIGTRLAQNIAKNIQYLIDACDLNVQI